MPLSPNYNPKDNETQIYKQWMDDKVGKAKQQMVGTNHPLDKEGQTQSKEIHKTHSILMPPPNLTGDLHAGHAFQHYLMDTLSRLARQRGETNLWFPGVDHAGLQLEGVIDKLIKKGEFDETINNSPYLGGGNEVDGGSFKPIVEAITVSPLSEQKNHMNNNRDDLPKYLKTNYPDLWLECAWSKVNLWRDNQKNQSAVLGDTPDYDKTLFTLDPQNIEMVNYAFLKYWQDGLIYKGSYLVNWSVGLQTALSDVAGEIEYEKRIDPFVTFEYKLFSKNKIEQITNNTVILSTAKDPLIVGSEFQPLNNSILVGTVRPETIFGDYAVAVHPEVFERNYNEFRGLLDEKKLFVQLPLTDKMIPVILANEVDPNFGSGALKITPANDQIDYDIFNKYLGGEFEGAIGRDGKLTEICGGFTGQSINEGRANVIKALIEEGFVPKKQDNQSQRKDTKDYFGIEFADDINPEDYQIDWNYEHNVTICERTKTVVEPLISEEFFISYHKEFNWKPVSKDDNVSIANRGKKTNLQKLGIEAVQKTNFCSEEYKARGVNFLENIKDWCISRDLIWGHKMPVWYNLDTNTERKFYSFEEMQQNTHLSEGVKPEGFGVIPNNKHFAISPTKPTTSGNWVQEEKILDTWFSSCLWPLSTLKYPEFVENKKHKSNVVLIHGGEIWNTKETYRSKLQNGDLNSYWYQSKEGFKRTFKSDLKDFCKDDHISFIDPQMPNKTNADYTKWKWVFEQSLPFITSETILVGHSLGSMFLTKYLSENKLEFKSVFLVSGGLWKDSETKILDFDTKWGIGEDFSLLSCYDNKINIVHSKDDNVIDFQRSLDLKEKLPNANFIELEGFGHLNQQCEELLDLLKKRLKNYPLDKEGQSESFREIQTDFETFYPTQEMTTGKDIFYQWIVRMTTLSYYFTAQIPYTDLVITPTILDDKGKKMSKSLGNGMDPVAQIDKYSSDAMRMAMLGAMIPDRNIKMGGRLADELCEKYRNFGNKMWNIARFFEYQEEKTKE